MAREENRDMRDIASSQFHKWSERIITRVEEKVVIHILCKLILYKVDLPWIRKGEHGKVQTVSWKEWDWRHLTVLMIGKSREAVISGLITATERNRPLSTCYHKRPLLHCLSRWTVHSKCEQIGVQPQFIHPHCLSQLVWAWSPSGHRSMWEVYSEYSYSEEGRTGWGVQWYWGMIFHHSFPQDLHMYTNSIGIFYKLLVVSFQPGQDSEGRRGSATVKPLNERSVFAFSYTV
jgi:hypothetical protein